MENEKLEKMIKHVRIIKIGSIKIVSSGYTDRYVSGDVWTKLTVDGIDYRVDGDDSTQFAAFLKLAGISRNDLTSDQIEQIGMMIIKTPIFSWISYEIYPAAYSIKTTAHRIRAGIEAATGYPNLNENGINEYRPIAETLSSQEWTAIKYGLDKINNYHAQHGMPVVNFTIPEADNGSK